MLLSADFPLNVRIIWSDPFPNGSYFYVACVCNHCHWTNYNCCSMMGLMSHLSCVYDAFSFYGVSFSLMTSLMMMVLGPGHQVHAIFISSENFIGCISGSKSVYLVIGLFLFSLVIDIFSFSWVNEIFISGRVISESWTVRVIWIFWSGQVIWIFWSGRVIWIIWSSWDIWIFWSGHVIWIFLFTRVPELFSQSKTFKVSNLESLF